MLYLKLKFFLNRIVVYFSFFLFPIWGQKTLDLNTLSHSLIASIYCLLMMAQWFLLGKEIDYLLKIYFRANSSLDRIVCKVFTGMFFTIIYFNFITFFLPKEWHYNTFWITWTILGFFYSWPTRGKIIQESVSTNFHEYKYLDSFEKAILSLILIFIIISIPDFSNLNTSKDLKLFFNPDQKISSFIWNFLEINYYPFKKYPQLFNLSYHIHFYFLNVSMYLLTFYALLRYFVSRRLAILGIFSVISSWSFSIILNNSYSLPLFSLYSLLWAWSFLWVSKSSTYRSGLFIGLLGAWGVAIDRSNLILFLTQLLLLHFVFLKEKTKWYRKQFLKYNLLGIILIPVIFIFSNSALDHPFSFQFNTSDIIKELSLLFQRKAFFSLSFLGISIFIYKLFHPHSHKNITLNIQQNKLNEIGATLFSIFVLSIFFNINYTKNFGGIWILSFFSLLPLELIFQKISRIQSSKNMIYLIYIIICLADSHLEERIKILSKLFN